MEALNLGGGGSGGMSFLAAGFDLNVPLAENTVAFGYRSMTQDFLSSRYDRSTGSPIEGKLKVMSASRVWHWPARYGYVSSSVGLSLLNGTLGEDCEKANSIFYPRFSCVSKDVSTVGIPLRVSAGFGRYAGIAAHFEINLNPEAPYILYMVSFPIGKFAR